MPTPLEAPEREAIERSETRNDRDRLWNVIVWNDPVTLMDYVVYVLRKLFGYDKATASRLMMQVHEEGRAVVSSGPREKAEMDVHRLHAHGLQATLSQDQAVRYPRLVRHADGGVRVTLPVLERSLLQDMVGTLRDVIDGVDPDTPPDELVGRLFPRAYDDPLDDMEYAETGVELLAEAKRTLLDMFSDSLAQGTVRGEVWRIDLDPEQTAAWLAVLQDGRLVLAQVVGIQTEADWERVAQDDEHAAVVLTYLGELLNGLVLLLDAGLPED